jgi:hypothetical protein
MARQITPAKVGTKEDKPKSAYNPGKIVRKRIAQIQRDNEVAQTIMSSTYEEFGSYGSTNNGNFDLINRMNANQKMFNQYRPSKSQDPDLQWHSNALKPIVRNKVISIVSHITTNILYPDVVAQNEDSVEDKDMADVMKDAVIWACEQSKYEDMFIQAVQDLCVNPAVILYQDYAEATRTIKENVNEKIELKEIVDELYSGFISSIIPLDELFIGNIYEPNIQKQPFLIRRRIIDFVSAQRKYGDKDDFKKFVRPGVKTYFNEDEDLFYDDYDDQQEDRLVEEVIYYNRFADLELVFVNGILLTHSDEGMRRKDKQYPFAKSVYETYNSRFFYGMSLAQKLENDEDLVNTLYRMILDGTYLQLMPPWAVYGETDVDAGDFAPRSITTFTDPNTRVEPMQLGQNINAGMSTLQLVEQSTAESSKQDYSPKSDTTAREIAFMEENIKIMLGRTGQMVGSLVRDFGQLLVASIIQYLPIAQIGETVGDTTRLKFPTLFLADLQGKSKKIDFTAELPEAATEEELEELEKEKSFELLSLEEKLNMTISEVDPQAFRELKYTSKVKTTFVSQSTKFAKKMMLFDRLLNNPNVKQKELIKATLLEELEPGHEDEYLVDEDQMQTEMAKMLPKAPTPTVNNAAFTA